MAAAKRAMLADKENNGLDFEELTAEIQKIRGNQPVSDTEMAIAKLEFEKIDKN